MGLEVADEGTVSFAKDTTIGYLEQEAKLEGTKTALQEVVDSAVEVKEVERLVRDYEHRISHDQVSGFVLSWDTRKLSQAALETLAVVAYHQPVTREGVRAIRGVNSEGVISSLIEKGLVREMGHEADRGQAILYGTTRHFLERFGLRSLHERLDSRHQPRGAPFAHRSQRAARGGRARTTL